MNISSSPTHRQAGFSLVEMLVVIAVIGVIAAIAIPNIGGLNTSARKAVNQRNAQNLVSTYNSGAAAGIVWTGSSKGEKVAAVVAGDAPSAGAFIGKSFQVKGLSPDDQTATYPYVGIDGNGDLFYDIEGGQPTS